MAEATGRRPRCGKPIRGGNYWGQQVCGLPEGHPPGKCMSVDAYKRYLEAQRNLNARRYAAQREPINAERRKRYAQARGIDKALRQLRFELRRWPAA